MSSISMSSGEGDNISNLRPDNILCQALLFLSLKILIIPHNKFIDLLYIKYKKNK